MLDVVLALLRSVLSGFRSHSWLVLENLAFRHQLDVLKRQTRKPKLRPAERLLWVGLWRFWPSWRHALVLFQPQTVIAWHRLGFRLFWRWKSRLRLGRPFTDDNLIALIHRIWQANPTWGSRRIQSELASWALPSRIPPSANTDLIIGIPSQLRLGRPFFTTMPKSWSHSISLPSRRPCVGCCMSFWSWLMSAAKSFTSTSPTLLRPSGRPNKWSRLFHLPPRPVICPGSRCHLSRRFRPPNQELGLGTKAHCLAGSLAESRGRTPDRFPPSGMLGPRRLIERKISTRHSHGLLGLLSLSPPGQVCPEPRAIELPNQGEIIELPFLGGLHHRYTRQAA